jgi:hypothetical protein
VSSNLLSSHSIPSLSSHSPPPLASLRARARYRSRRPRPECACGSRPALGAESLSTRAQPNRKPPSLLSPPSCALGSSCPVSSLLPLPPRLTSFSRPAQIRTAKQKSTEKSLPSRNAVLPHTNENYPLLPASFDFLVSPGARAKREK